MPSNKEYWRKRFEVLENNQHNKGVEYYNEIQNLFHKTNADIEKEIAKWYMRIADNNEISYSSAVKLLDKNRLKEFKWSVDDYIKYGVENAVDQQWMKELENASAKVHISRLESIKIQLQQHIEKLFADYENRTNELLGNAYKDQYYNTAFEIAKGTGIGTNLHEVDQKTIDTVLNRPWSADGSNFSDRIWNNKKKLINNLNIELTQGIIRGSPAQKIIDSLSKKLDVSKKQSGALIMTESAAISSKAQQQCFNDLDVEKYEIVATLDTHTSDICRALDGKVFDMKDYQVGSTAPPFHVHCRTVTVPYFEDNYTERAARDILTGKSYYVPGDIKFNDWYDQYVKGNPEAVLKEKKTKNLNADMKQYQEYKKNLGKDIPNSIDGFQNLKYNNSEKWSATKALFRKTNAYNRIIRNEPAITNDLKNISDATGVKMVGLEYRVKTKDSFLRKVNTDSGNSIDFSMIDYTIGSTNDVIRYTYQSDVEYLVDAYNSIQTEIVNKGYKVVKVKNTWLDNKNPYNGINTIVQAPNGQKFEIQYHTNDSFELKNGRMHELYEKQRIIVDKESEEYLKLQDEMFDLSDALTVPKNIKKVKKYE